MRAHTHTHAPLSNAAGTSSSAPGAVRGVDPEFGEGHEVAFADCFPLLVAAEENLAALNAVTGEQLPMQRFRPNGGSAMNAQACAAAAPPTRAS